jgi:hypothetical protein
MFVWCECCVLSGRVRRADHSSRGVLPTVMRRCVWSRKPQEWGGRDPRWVATPQKKKKNTTSCLCFVNVFSGRPSYFFHHKNLASFVKFNFPCVNNLWNMIRLFHSVGGLSEVI